VQKELRSSPTHEQEHSMGYVLDVVGESGRKLKSSESVEGRGTTFTITLPVAPDGTPQG